VAYRVEFKPSAAESFRKLDKPVQRRLTAKLNALKENPRPHGAEKLKGEKDLYRLRSGDYRLICQVQDEILLVLVLGVGHRKDIYRILTR
jgi:mRNA interferase RelE/StbE